jgi:hypothetical protein
MKSTSRLSLILSVAISMIVASDAGASRSPTTAERKQIAREVLIELEADNPVLPIRVKRVVISTQRPGATSPYSKFALANFTALDAKGDPLDEIYGILGYSKRFRAWHVIGYGSDDVGCDAQDAALFGGRRAAILRDLGPTC